MWTDFCNMWLSLGMAAHIHHGRGKYLQLPLRWVAAAFGHPEYLDA